MSLPLYVHSWLNNRCITDEIIETSGISWDGERIVIPVRDMDGNFLFNKYRRDPRKNEGAKYTYAKGAHTALYGAEQLTNTEVPEIRYICEGELDSLVLRGHGLEAFSTTGGAGSFDPAWLAMLSKRSIYCIVYDADIAGYKGALTVYRQLATNGYRVHIGLLPAGKDVTDFFVAGNTKAKFIDTVCLRPVRFMFDLGTEQGLRGAIEELQETLATNPDLADEYSGFYTQTLSTLQSELAYIKKQRREKVRIFRGDEGDATLTEVKSIPITDFIEFNRRGFASCIFHNEHTASMRYYEDKNIVHCFGCGVTRNIIQVYAQLHNMKWREAFKALKERYGK